MYKRWKRTRKVGEDLFVAPGSSRSLLIYREGMLPLRVHLSEVEALVRALRSVSDDLSAGTGPPDDSIPRLDDQI